MRKLHKLTNPNHVDRVFTLKDFAKYTQSSQGLVASDKGLAVIETGVAKEVVSANGLDVRRFYQVRDCFYAYLEGGSVVRYDGHEWIEIMVSEAEPYIIPFKVSGEQTTLIVGDSACTVDDDGQINLATAPYGNCATIYNDMLFVATDNVVRFSKLFDYQDFSSGIDNSGYVCTDENYGEVLALIPRKNELVVVCQRAIYYLITANERQNYSLVKQDVAIKARKGSVKNAGDVVYLFNDNALCKYKNGILTKVNCNLSADYKFNGQSGVDNNTYYAGLTDGEENVYLLAYNGITGSASITQVQSLLISDGGYFIEGDSVKELTQNTVTASEFSWQSIELDFDSSRIKSLVGIEVRTSVPVELELKYSYGKQRHRFVKGLSLLKTHVADNKFYIKLNFDSSNVNVEYVRFIYRLQEE